MPKLSLRELIRTCSKSALLLRIKKNTSASKAIDQVKRRRGANGSFVSKSIMPIQQQQKVMSLISMNLDTFMGRAKFRYVRRYICTRTARVLGLAATEQKA